MKSNERTFNSTSTNPFSISGKETIGMKKRIYRSKSYGTGITMLECSGCISVSVKPMPSVTPAPCRLN
ncbi:Uncharacterised protein [Shigella sonnei]|nr:Uncharacterised protein [Shigella sonnei]